MSRILVLGAGVMGTAITVPLADNGHEVRLVGTHLDTDIIEEIHDSHRHPKLRSPVPNGVRPFTIQQLREAFEDIDLVILGVNSLGVRWAAETLSPFLQPGAEVLSLTKGLDGDGERLLLLPEVFQETLPQSTADKVKIAAIGGPSIAGELAARRHTSIVVTGHDKDFLTSIQKILNTDYYHVDVDTDVIGVEVSVGLKNLYAIGVGIVQGIFAAEDKQTDRDALHNLEGALFTQSINESTYLVDWLGGHRETVYSLAGVGDLYVTCQGGRNSKMGRYIGMGMTYEQARDIYMVDETIEGAEIAMAIDETLRLILRKGELDPDRIPLLMSLCDLICRNERFDPEGTL